MAAAHASLIELERALLDPSGRASPSLLDRLLSDDFVEIGASGRRFGKADAMAMLQAETGVRIETGEIDGREIASGVVLLQYASMRHEAGQTVRHALRSSLWTQTADGWRMVFHQGTVVPTVAATP